MHVCTNNQQWQCLEYSLNCSLYTDVHYSSIPKAAVTDSENQLEASVAPAKCTWCRSHLHLSVLISWLEKLWASYSKIVHIWFSFWVSETCLPWTLVCIRSNSFPVNRRLLNVCYIWSQTDANHSILVAFISLSAHFLSSFLVSPRWKGQHCRCKPAPAPSAPPRPAARPGSAAGAPSLGRWWRCSPSWSRACSLGAGGNCGRGCGGWCERRDFPRRAWSPGSSGCRL